MLHKGNINKIKVTEKDIVDVVIGGSPCQDLSVAGKRAGLKHEANGDEETTRSGLFMEQIRVCKEMRELDKFNGRTGVAVRPRWCVWENVQGALSSNNGEDFRIVLEEFCKVADSNASVSRPANGKWSNSGCIMGDAFSVAWRIMDARYHGVPQRRRRITLVADFAGQSAPKILFDEEGMRWDFETSQETWKRAAGSAQRGVAGGGRNRLVENVASFMGGQGSKAGGLGYHEEISPTLKSTPSGSNCVPDCVYGICGNVVDRDSHSNGFGTSANISPTLNTQDKHAVAYAIARHDVRHMSTDAPDVAFCIQSTSIDRGYDAGCEGKGWADNVAYTLNTRDRHAVVYDARGNGDGATCCTITGEHCNRVTDYTPIVMSVDCRNLSENEEMSATLQANPNGGFSYNDINPVDFEAHRFGEYREGVGTLKRSGGDCGNGSETLVCSVYPETTGALCANSHPGSYTGQDAFNDMLPVIKENQRYIVRRLTPLECSRLQGLPEDWCVVPPQQSVTDEDLAFWKPFWDEWMQINGKKPKTENQIIKWLMSEVSESAQYQMYGNGIAAPQWFWVCGRIIETYGEKKPTMASLFDGTGSFPWIWNTILNGQCAIWSSEVNPDAVRVSRYRIG